MIARTCLLLSILPSFVFTSISASPLVEQFERAGYVEIDNRNNPKDTFEALYACFDELIVFLQTHPQWAQKLYIAKERFIRSKERTIYSTDVFGFYDDSTKEGRSQISFYYSTHFHAFISSRFPEFNQIPEMIRFFETCDKIQTSYESLFQEAAAELGLEGIFEANGGRVPILFKVIKYLPSYVAIRPHYDGTMFSLFLDSTDNQSLLLSPYKASYTIYDFTSPVRQFPENSILLIPGTLLSEFSLYPTPHIVSSSGRARYATIAFAMRPSYFSQKNEFTFLPRFTD